jgi:hypothetical protein
MKRQRLLVSFPVMALLNAFIPHIGQAQTFTTIDLPDAMHARHTCGDALTDALTLSRRSKAPRSSARRPPLGVPG